MLSEHLTRAVAHASTPDHPEIFVMLTRGKLATATGCHIETIRYYENIGLLPQPERSASGYRRYDDEHLRRLRFIQRAKALGFSSAQIHSLLELTDSDGNHTRADVKSLTEAHIDEISARIRDLQKIKRRLNQISSFCDGSDESAQTCPIIESLFDER